MANQGNDLDEIISKANNLSIGLNDEVVVREDESSKNEEEDDGLLTKSVVGRVLARRHCNVKFLQTIFNRKWSFAGRWRVKILKKDEFSTFVGFTFENQDIAARVSNAAIWHYHGGFLIVEKWPASGVWSDAALNGVPAWVRIHGFPILALNRTNVKKFGEMAGEILELPWYNQNRIMLNGYARLRIKFPIDKRIFVGKFIPINGKKVWIQIRFENLPLVCFGCGKWGHDEKECSNEMVYVKDSHGSPMRLYGPWLKNESYLGSCFDSKVYEKLGNLKKQINEDTCCGQPSVRLEEERERPNSDDGVQILEVSNENLNVIMTGKGEIEGTKHQAMEEANVARGLNIKVIQAHEGDDQEGGHGFDWVRDSRSISCFTKFGVFKVSIVYAFIVMELV